MVWTNVFFFQFPGIKQKPGKGNFRDLKSQNITGGACPRAPLEACFLGPSFRTSVSIYPRSAPGLGDIFARHKAVIQSVSRYFSMFVVCNWHHKQSEQDNRDAAPLRSVTFCQRAPAPTLLVSLLPFLKALGGQLLEGYWNAFCLPSSIYTKNPKWSVINLKLKKKTNKTICI